MAIEIWEAWDSRDAAIAKKGSDTTHRARWFAAGSDDDAEIKAYASFQIPSGWANPGGGDPLERQSIDVKRVGNEHWELDVHYGAKEDEDSQEEPETESGDYSFETGGATQNVQQAVTVGEGGARKPGQKVYNQAGLVADNEFGGAVNVHGKGADRKPHGTDIVIPTLKFSRTHYLPNSQVTLDYVKTLARMTGKTNKSAWNGFAAGELLFLGASGQRRGVKDWQVTFNFDASENRTNVVVGDSGFKITVPSVKGWEYLWVYWSDTDNDALHILVPQPLFACVAQMYEETEFSALGIGA